MLPATSRFSERFRSTGKAEKVYQAEDQSGQPPSRPVCRSVGASKSQSIPLALLSSSFVRASALAFPLPLFKKSNVAHPEIPPVHTPNPSKPTKNRFKASHRSLLPSPPPPLPHPLSQAQDQPQVSPKPLSTSSHLQPRPARPSLLPCSLEAAAPSLSISGIRLSRL